MFQAVYDHPLHIPISCWVGCVAAAVIAIASRGVAGRTRGLLVSLAIVCAADAWLTGPWSPLAPTGAAMTAASVTFVIAGDLRYFLLVERALRGPRAAAWGVATALSLLVPVAMQGARAAGLAGLDARWTFLVYELLFLVLALALRLVVLPRRLEGRDDATRAFVLRLTGFEIVQYAGWAGADVVLLLAKADVGHLVRVAPNMMYYTFFLIFAALAERARARATAATAAKAAPAAGALAVGSVLAALALVGCSKRTDAPPQVKDDGRAIAFVRDGKPVRTVTLAELRAAAPPETVAGFDPYYQKPKTFRALPLRAVLEKGFEGQGVDLAKQEYVFRAKDGYAVPMRGALATEEGGAIAFEDTEVPGWEPIGPQRADPAPFYLVWRKPEQATLDSHPRPWQLVTIEMARFDAVYPDTSPGAVAEGSPVARGYGLFRDHCVQCHAVNRQGGRVGPDLNVPRNVLEYRPEDQVRAYVKNPRAFRYGNMPAHEFLGDADLDALIAYLRAMKDRKHDPGK